MAENITDISYLMILDKIYTVTSISFADMTITAEDEGINKKDVPECEIFGVEDVEEFSIKLVNRITPAEIIDFLAVTTGFIGSVLSTLRYGASINPYSLILA